MSLKYAITAEVIQIARNSCYDELRKLNINLRSLSSLYEELTLLADSLDITTIDHTSVSYSSVSF